MKDLRKYNLVYSVIIAIILLIALTHIYIATNIWKKAIEEKSTMYNEGWILNYGESKTQDNITLPTNIKGYKKDSLIEIENILPDDIKEKPFLLLRSGVQRVKVYIDDKLIFSLEKDKKQLFGTEPESRWIFVDLSSYNGGERIKISFSSKYKLFNKHINNIVLGNKIDLYKHILSLYGYGIIIAVLFFGIGLILSAIYIGLFKSKGKYISIFYLAITNFVVALWLACDNKAVELFLPKGFPLAEFKIISLYMTGTILMIFFSEALNCNKCRFMKYLINTNVIFIILSTSLHLLNIIHFVETIFIFHLIILIGSLFLVYYSIIELKNKKSMSKYILLWMAVTMFAAILDVFSYYITNGQESSIYFRIALLIFSIVFSIVLGKEVFSLYNEELKSKIYKDLAYTDSLTGMKNRAAFHEKMNDIINNINEYKSRKFFLFDLNNLKGVNDNLGHDKGDEYIREVSYILKSVYQEYGQLYRIGGDEFVFISDTIVDSQKLINNMNINCDILKSRFEDIDIGVACGVSDIITQDSEDPYSAYSRADKNMYEVKRSMKRIR